ncbi:Nucleolar protein 13 [Marasmius tenuissimus]|uniref:Nucleolar protein 13 n=1 Tax=Marasmius tenuissimus TaxID=585030 RepID=A0ABR3A9W1_9AGAR
MASSSSSSSSSSSPEPPSKRKRVEKVEKSDSGSDSSSSSSESEAEDETPVSHAEKRRQKKKAKLAEKKGKESKTKDDEPASKKRKLADGSATATNSDGKPQRQNSVWVGNLSFKTTPQDLKTFFDGAGEITRIHMPMKAGHKPGMKGENRGFAYIDFATADAKTVAITLSERPLIGRKLLIKDGDDFAGRPAQSTTEGATDESGAKGKSHSKTAQKILKVQKQPPAPTLFVGNLPFETTEAQIKELLEAHKKKPKKEKGKDEDEEDESKGDEEGEPWIRKIRMGTFEDTGLCKGWVNSNVSTVASYLMAPSFARFAFIDFSSVDHATSALVNPRNHHLNGRNLVVEYASADAVRRGPNKQHVGAGPGEGKKRPSKPREGTPGKRFEKKQTWKDEPHSTHMETDEGSGVKEGTEEGGDETEKKPWKGPDGPRQKDPRHRLKPGAALAQAKRQSAAIVPATGKKIVF